MHALDKYLAEYQCPKCRNRTYQVQTASISRMREKLPLLGRGNNRYALVSCGLCGYTEFFNLKILVNAECPSEAKLHKVEEAESS